MSPSHDPFPPSRVTIPAAITFDPGDLYRLWLQSRNAQGSSTPGPKQNWTA